MYLAVLILDLRFIAGRDVLLVPVYVGHARFEQYERRRVSVFELDVLDIRYEIIGFFCHLDVFGHNFILPVIVLLPLVTTD